VSELDTDNFRLALGVNMEAVGKITLLFAAFGALAGLISGAISSAGAALLLAILFFYGSYRLACSMFGIIKPALSPPAPTPTATQVQKPIERRKIVTTGIWPFFIMWLILWIITYTIKLTV